MLRPSCLTASSIPQSGSTACSISATPYLPKNPPLKMAAFLQMLKRGTETLIPKSIVQNQNHAKSRQIRKNPTFPSFPPRRLLSHLTNSRPTLPLGERTHVKRFSGSKRGHWTVARPFTLAGGSGARRHTSTAGVAARCRRRRKRGWLWHGGEMTLFFYQLMRWVPRSEVLLWVLC